MSDKPSFIETVTLSQRNSKKETAADDEEIHGFLDKLDTSLEPELTDRRTKKKANAKNDKDKEYMQNILI